MIERKTTRDLFKMKQITVEELISHLTDFDKSTPVCVTTDKHGEIQVAHLPTRK